MAFPAYGVTVPSLSTLQFQYNGLTMGPGTPYTILNLMGIGDLPSLASNDQQRSRQHGEFAGFNLLAGREIEIDLAVGYANSGSTTQARVRALQAAVNPMLTGTTTPNAELPLWMQLPNDTLVCSMCRLVKSSWPYDANWANSNLSKGNLWFHATDPRLYGQPVQVQVTGTSPLTAVTTYTGNIDVNPQATLVLPSGASTATITGYSNTNSSGASGTSGWSVNVEPGTTTGSTTYIVDSDLHTVTKAGSPYYNAAATTPTWTSIETTTTAMLGSSGYASIIASWSGGGSATLTLNYCPAWVL